MKIRSPIPRKRTRIEIIPLIDIMFFLLASFMMVSLQMQKVQTIKASLPTATLARAAKPEMINLFVDKEGQVSMDKKPLSFPELANLLAERSKASVNIPIYITGNKETPHGAMIYVLDFMKRQGMQQVAISVKAENP